MNAQLSTSLRRIGLPAFSAGVGILLAGAAIVVATFSRPAVPARQSAVQTAPRSSVNVNVPISGTGSAYDGKHYGGFDWAPRSSANVNVPISGTGSAYDGKHYGSVAPRTSVNVPISGTGSAYDGKHYGGFISVPRSSANVNVPISGTGSAYDGR